MSPCSLLPCKVVTALPPPCVCRVCLVRVLCGPARRGRVFPETAGAHAVVAEGAQGPRDQGQGGGRPGGHLGHPGGARGSGATTGSHARGQAESWGPRRPGPAWAREDSSGQEARRSRARGPRRAGPPLPGQGLEGPEPARRDPARGARLLSEEGPEGQSQSWPGRLHGRVPGRSGSPGCPQDRVGGCPAAPRRWAPGGTPGLPACRPPSRMQV